MEKFVFGIDMDYVLADWEGEGSMFKDIWERRFPDCRYRGVKNSPHWSIHKNYPAELRSEIVKIYKTPTPGFYKDLPLMIGAIEAISILKDFGEIVIVSTPVTPSLFDLQKPEEQRKYSIVVEQVKREKTIWVAENIYPVLLGKMPEIKFLEDKSLFDGHVLIDDNPHVTTGCSKTPSWKHILYNDDYLYNRDSKIENQICWTKDGWLTTILDAAKGNSTFKPNVLA